MGLRPYVGKPAGGKVHNLNEIAMVWIFRWGNSDPWIFFCSNTLAAHRLRVNQPLHIRNALVKLSMCSWVWTMALTFLDFIFYFFFKMIFGSLFSTREWRAQNEKITTWPRTTVLLLFFPKTIADSAHLRNYNLSFARQQHHDMGCTPCCIAMMSTSRDFRRSPQVQRHEWRQFLWRFAASWPRQRALGFGPSFMKMSRWPKIRVTKIRGRCKNGWTFIWFYLISRIPTVNLGAWFKDVVFWCSNPSFQST